MSNTGGGGPASTLWERGGTRRREKGESSRPAEVPSSRRGKYLQLDARREDLAARKGK